ncbi:thymidylate synthase, flavin-dependent [Alkaliphilus oremlandii OhILAs]|uniref:Flavin-dependent thymidylate synthase n=2 Tax=Alkaliphilus oremlandii TaxID=461876 RepID=A8MLC0_ALKOO|nr:FAD-dependent thymidylate synthase [Alkaliphilus oremlandii]ABW18034.1 thymidylate synthase, flavin-dependent [Alkaliphilus oremlandii OhILAs]
MESKMKVSLITYTPEPEKLVAGAAKLCYSPSGINELMSNLEEGNVEKFIAMLAIMGHESPFEHINFTFGIEGVSRSLTHQLVRHRIGSSYSQKSQRYVNEGGFEYIIPPQIGGIPEAKALYIKTMENDQLAYDELTNILFEKHYKDYLDKGKNEKAAKSAAEKQAIEDARYVLPNSCETKIVVTMNARALFNFFRKRCCNRAQWEIRDLAIEMMKLVVDVAPNVFKIAGPGCVTGKCPEGNMSCGEMEAVREKFKSISNR